MVDEPHNSKKLINNITDSLFADTDRRTIGVASCDIDQDGFEEIYFLNTDTYSGEKNTQIDYLIIQM